MQDHAPVQEEDPPPSYHEAIASTTAPLLVGAPPDYGAFRAYPEPDHSSIASSQVGYSDRSDRTCSEWVGQALVVFVFVTIIYAFWKLINAPDHLHNFPA
ncbi:hypothetical protein GQ44DRAFT_772999 [Phaeosphaeriaceae sp. PMI808]|nr:hypothetical protein GQ44DRAFT_772999 [Phaeosphaeriaceae sp. PMI808]